MGALSDAPWRLMVCDVLFFLAFGMGNVVIPLLVVAREATRCDASDADACGAVAARRLVVYGLCSGVPQTLVGAALGRACDARGPRVVLFFACLGGAASLAVACAFAYLDLPFYVLLVSGVVQGLCGGYAALLAASFAYAARSGAAKAGVGVAAPPRRRRRGVAAATRRSRLWGVLRPTAASSTRRSTRTTRRARRRTRGPSPRRRRGASGPSPSA